MLIWMKSKFIITALIVLVSQTQAVEYSDASQYNPNDYTLTQEWITYGRNAQRHFATSEYINPPLQEQWQMNFPDVNDIEVPTAIAADGKLFVTVRSDDQEKSLIAYDPQSGEIIWSKGFVNEAYFTSAAYDNVNDRLYAATDYEIFIFNADDGAQLDQFDFPKPGSCGVWGLVVDNGYLYGSICDLVVKYDLDGNLIWEFKDYLNTWGFGMSPPAIGNDLLYVGGTNSHLVGLDLETGEMVWEIRTPGDPTGGIVYGDGIVFAGCVGGGSFPPQPKVIAVNAQTGEYLWGIITDYGGSIYATMSYSDGILYFGSNDQFVYAIDTVTPRILWATDLYSDVYGNVIRTSDVVYAYSYTGLYALDFESGEIIWEKSFERPVHRLLAYEGYLFVTSGMDLFGLESTPVLHGFYVNPASLSIYPGEQRVLQIVFEASYNYPDAYVDLTFSPLPDGLTLSNIPTQPIPVDVVNLSLSAGSDITSFDRFPITVKVVINDKEFTQTVQILVAKTAQYLPLVER